MSKAKRRNRERRNVQHGAPPETLTIHPDAKKSDIHVIAYSHEDFTESPITDVETIRHFLNHWPVTWVNVDGLGDLDTIRKIGAIFDLHGLALEDVLSLDQRPKVEEYGEHVFLVVRMPEPGFPVQTEQLSVFVGMRFIITFQERTGGDCLNPVRKRIRDGLGRVRSMGPDYLAYSLVDTVIDAYFPILDEMSDRMEDLEEEVVRRPGKETVAEIHRIRRDLITIRRIMAPIRDMMNALIRDGAQSVTDITRMYLRDCYDHAVHILDLVETYREIAAGLLDVYLSSVSNRMNEIMKVLTMIATIFIPLSFFAGIYGMNFDYEASPFNMPELHSKWGYPCLLLFMASVAVLQLFFFWRKGWLGRSTGTMSGPKSAPPEALSDTPSANGQHDERAHAPHDWGRGN